MNEFCLLAASLVAQGQLPGGGVEVPPAGLVGYLPAAAIDLGFPWCRLDADAEHPATKTVASKPSIAPTEITQPEFSHAHLSIAQLTPISQVMQALPLPQQQPNLRQLASTPAPAPAISAANSEQPIQNKATTITSTPVRPITGGQLYRQRLAALRSGSTYTRLPSNSFQEDWINTTDHPSYRDWVGLLHQEARAMSRGQGSSRLSILMGDSLSQWFPTDLLPQDRFWLNQGISGDTTTGVLQRLEAVNGTQPDMIHVMVGINDLRRGATDREVENQLQQIMRNLKQAHPQAKIIVHSILPTRLASLPTDRIRRLNYQIANLAKQEGVFFLNLQPAFMDESGLLRRDLTTDGIHLSQKGYQVWDSVIASIL